MVGTLVEGRRCASSCCDPGLTFNLPVVTLNFKSCPGCILASVRCRKLILSRDISGSTSWSDLDSTFDLVIVTLSLKILSGLYLINHKMYKVDTWWGHWLEGVGMQCMV